MLPPPPPMNHSRLEPTTRPKTQTQSSLLVIIVLLQHNVSGKPNLVLFDDKYRIIVVIDDNIIAKNSTRYGLQYGQPVISVILYPHHIGVFLSVIDRLYLMCQKVKIEVNTKVYH